MCKKCNVEDDESHRMNFCSEWGDINRLKSSDKIEYDLIFSANQNESIEIVELIIKMWDLGNNRYCMRSVN